MKPLIVTAATKGSRYEDCLKIQKETYGDGILTVEFPRMSWEKGTKIKPEAIRKAFKKSDVVFWMDSDCWVDLPDELPEGDWDICTTENIHPKHFHRISAGFILLRNTKAVRNFLSEWDNINKRYNKDHPALIKALQRNQRYLKMSDMTEWLKGRHKINVLSPERGIVDETGTLSKKFHPYLKVQILPCRFPLKEQEWPLSMQAGIMEYDDVSIGEKYDPSADVHIFWGLRRQHYQDALAGGKPFIVVERGYLGDRISQWFSVGVGGLNGLANFNTSKVTPARFKTLWEPLMQPWRHDGEYALVMGQVPGDASLYGQNIDSWAMLACGQAKRAYSAVFYRHHPDIRPKDRPDFGVPLMQGDLKEAIENAKVVITYSSNTAVDAVMAGVPAVSTIPGSMAWEVTSHNIEDPLIYPDREEWAAKLAYSQWSLAEIREGKPWLHLRSLITQG